MDYGDHRRDLSGLGPVVTPLDKRNPSVGPQNPRGRSTGLYMS